MKVWVVLWQGAREMFAIYGTLAGATSACNAGNQAWAESTNDELIVVEWDVIP